MRYLNLIFILFFLTVTGTASAEIMSQDLGQRISTGFDTLRVQQADKDREARGSVRFAYKSDVHRHLSLGAALQVAPDLIKKSGRVNITKDFYTVLGEAVASYTYLFRYNVGFGLGLLHQRISYNVYGEKPSFTQTYPLATLSAGLAYAINQQWEVGLASTYYLRWVEGLSDWSYGASLAYVLR